MRRKKRDRGCLEKWLNRMEDPVLSEQWDQVEISVETEKKDGSRKIRRFIGRRLGRWVRYEDSRIIIVLRIPVTVAVSFVVLLLGGLTYFVLKDPSALWETVFALGP